MPEEKLAQIATRVHGVSDAAAQPRRIPLPLAIDPELPTRYRNVMLFAEVACT